MTTPTGISLATYTDKDDAWTSGVYANRPCGCSVAGNGTIPHPLTVKPCAVCAAAPDLLAACEKVLNYLEDGTPTDERSDAENFAIVQLVDAIRKAGGTLPSEYTRALAGLSAK